MECNHIKDQLITPSENSAEAARLMLGKPFFRKTESCIMAPPTGTAKIMGRGVGFAERKRDNYLAFREGHSVIPIVTVEGYEVLFLPLEDLDSSSQIKTRLPQRTGATPSPSWWPRPSATGSCRADRGMSHRRPMWLEWRTGKPWRIAQRAYFSNAAFLWGLQQALTH